MRPPPHADAAAHIRFVDGLRAVAILGVLAHHTTINSAAWMDLPIAPLLYEGRHGVDLFFVVSGFCLAYPLLAAQTDLRRFDVFGYAAKRLYRIFPTYWAALALLAAASMLPVWRFVAAHSVSVYPALSAVDTLREIVMLDRPPFHNWSFWTLGIELRWYVVMPLLAALFVRSRPAFALLGVAAVAAYYQSSLHVTDALMLPAFMLGITSAWCSLRRPRWIVAAPYACCACAAGAIWTVPGDQSPLWYLAAFFFVLSVLRMNSLHRLLSSRPLVAVGVASYSIYLVHEPVVAGAAALGVHPLLVPVIGLAAGFGLWCFVERPLNRPAARGAAVAALRAFLARAFATTPAIGPELRTAASAAPGERTPSDALATAAFVPAPFSAGSTN